MCLSPYALQVGGPPKLDPVTAMKQKLKDYGYMHMDAWDFLWSITAKAMLAAEILRPGGWRCKTCESRVVTCVEGAMAALRWCSGAGVL